MCVCVCVCVCVCARTRVCLRPCLEGKQTQLKKIKKFLSIFYSLPSFRMQTRSPNVIMVKYLFARQKVVVKGTDNQQ